MKTYTKLLIVLSTLLLVAPLAYANHCHTEHTKDGGEAQTAMKHDEQSGHNAEQGSMEHNSMQMHGGMIMLGEKEDDGVKADLHMKDVGEAMTKMGMNVTHHFMVTLTDVKSGKTLEDGVVALKIKGPSGEEGKAIKLMGMQGHFGVDVTLTEPGEYHFTVAAKMADGKTRKFEAEFTK